MDLETDTEIINELFEMVNNKNLDRFIDSKIGQDWVQKKLIGAEPILNKDSTFIYRVRELVKTLKEGDQILEVRLKHLYPDENDQDIPDIVYKSQSK